MVQHQHKAAQIRAEMSAGAVRQGRDEDLPIGRDPALASIADRPHRQHKLLHEVVHVTLETRPRRRGDPQNLVLDVDTGPDLATPRLAADWLCPRWRGGLLHAAGLDRWWTLQALQPGDLRLLGCDRLLQRSHLAQQLDHQFLELGWGQGIEVGRWRHSHVEPEIHAVANRENSSRRSSPIQCDLLDSATQTMLKSTLRPATSCRCPGFCRCYRRSLA